MRTALILAGLAAAVSAGEPQLLRATPEAVGMSSERLQTATAVLRQAVADRRIAGAVGAVARHGKIVYLEPVGLQDIARRTPMTDHSLFRIYSMTKAVTAAPRTCISACRCGRARSGSRSWSPTSPRRL